MVSRWPPLRPLCLILKVFLQQRELNEVWRFGVKHEFLFIYAISEPSLPNLTFQITYVGLYWWIRFLCPPYHAHGNVAGNDFSICIYKVSCNNYFETAIIEISNFLCMFNLLLG